MFNKTQIQRLQETNSLNKEFKLIFSELNITDKKVMKNCKKNLITKYKLGYPECIIFVGLPASGKSFTFNEKYKDSHLRINLDTLKGSKTKEKHLINACINGKISCVIDNTNVTKEKRKYYIDLFKETHKLGYIYFDVSLEELLRRNELRPNKIPKVAIYTLNKRLEKPTKKEFG